MVCTIKEENENLIATLMFNFINLASVLARVNFVRFDVLETSKINMDSN
jgi:hypothetical protein